MDLLSYRYTCIIQHFQISKCSTAKHNSNPARKSPAGMLPVPLRSSSRAAWKAPPGGACASADPESARSSAGAVTPLATQVLQFMSCVVICLPSVQGNTITTRIAYGLRRASPRTNFLAFRGAAFSGGAGAPQGDSALLVTPKLLAAELVAGFAGSGDPRRSAEFSEKRDSWVNIQQPHADSNTRLNSLVLSSKGLANPSSSEAPRGSLRSVPFTACCFSSAAKRDAKEALCR